MNTMKTKTKERRVLNVDKESYDLIKEYCDHYSLKMSDWLPKLALEHIFTAYQCHVKNKPTEEVNSPLPEFTSVVKQYVGKPEKFEAHLDALHRKLGIK